MRVLITGGAGFIGSHLAEAHLAQGDEVMVIDDLSTGSVENLARCRDQRGFHLHLDTVMNARLMAELVDLSDRIYHLAAAVGVRLIVESPVRTIETNIRGTEEVLRHAARKRKRILIASTSEVYGKTERVPFRETDDLVLGATAKGRWSYACSKAIDEFLAIAYWKEKQVPTVIVRLFNTVGPRQTGQYGMVIPNLIDQGLDGRPITVYGDGSQSRCFTHVADVVQAMMRLIEHPDARGEVYNLGSTEEVTILDLARRVQHLTGGRSEIVTIPYEVAYEEGFEDMRRRVPDITRIHDLIGYSPRHTLHQILVDVLADRQARDRSSAFPSASPRIAETGSAS
jgi:UDP-glucose 4-epimerase